MSLFRMLYCAAPQEENDVHPNPFNLYGISWATVLSPIGANDEPFGR